jgi:hypothetical protein
MVFFGFRIATRRRIEGVKANCQFALPLGRDFHSFRASQRDMKAPPEIVDSGQ